MNNNEANVFNDNKVKTFQSNKLRMDIVGKEFEKVDNLEKARDYLGFLDSLTSMMNRSKEPYEQPIDVIPVTDLKSKLECRCSIYYQANNYPLPLRFLKLDLIESYNVKPENYSLNGFKRNTMRDFGIGDIKEESKDRVILPFLIYPRKEDEQTLKLMTRAVKHTDKRGRYQIKAQITANNGETFDCRIVSAVDVYPPIELESNMLRNDNLEDVPCLFLIYDPKKYSHRKHENFFVDYTANTFVRYQQ